SGPKLLLSFGKADSDGRQAVRRRTGALGSFSFATCQPDRLNSCRLSPASGDTMNVHFHLIPPFYREAVYAAGRGPALGKYPDWTPELALDVMDAHGIEIALTSLAQPGVGLGSRGAACHVGLGSGGTEELALSCQAPPNRIKAYDLAIANPVAR